MPDWSYHPLSRPLLFRLPPALARDLTLGAIGRLARLPGGTAVIRFMGHMQPPAELKRSAWGITIASPVGLAAGLDARGVALSALAEFGFGFVEAGPVTLAPVSAGPIERQAAAIVYPDRPVNDGLAALAARLEATMPLRVPLGVRLAHRPSAGAIEAAEERAQLIERLAAYADFFTLETHGGAAEGAWDETAWTAHLTAVLATLRRQAPGRPLLLCLPPDLDPAAAERLLAPALARGVGGVFISGGLTAPAGRRLLGAPARSASLALVGALRQRWGADLPIAAGGGVHTPADALQLMAAGADCVLLHSGLVFGGPGLPKRINEAVVRGPWSVVNGRLRAARDPETTGTARQGTDHWPLTTGHSRGWLWTILLGVSMVLGGVLAWVVAATLVVLPYDEAFVGLSRAELAAINPRLLDFMAHDRLTLVGTMISIGALYASLAWFGIRQGAHWAWATVRASCAVGFASFGLAFGFGYVDPLHLAVTAILLPLFVLGLRRPPCGLGRLPAAQVTNDARWRLGLGGQLLLVALGVGLTLAGLSIATVGVTTVFVPADLAFMGTTGEALRAINPRLVPLIAHDRATFGGALTSNGVAVLLMALWGFRPGLRWLWWTLLVGGLPGFATVLSVHAAVGYLDVWHMAPVWVALAFFVIGLALAYPSLCAPTQSATAAD